MRNTIRFAVALVLFAAGLSACGGAARSDGPETGDANSLATVRVENQSTSDMRIYVAYGGQEIRLGTVTGLRTETFDIPRSVLGIGRELRFVADPLAGRSSASSFDIYVAPGEQVRMTIPPTVR